MVSAAQLADMTERVVARKQVRWRMNRATFETTDRRTWVGALIDEVVRATLLEVERDEPKK